MTTESTESVEPARAEIPRPAGPPAAPAPPPAQPPLAVVELSAGDVLGSTHPEDAPTGPRRPRRPRPVLLLTAALVLGVLGGAGIGYDIQAARPETPLPPLQVALPTYPAEVLDPAEAAAAKPERLAIDGDLRKLVMTAPAGSEPWGDYPDTPSWRSIGELAEHYGDSVRMFRSFAQEGFRRAAEVDWKKDGVKFRVTLIQYGRDNGTNAKLRAKEYGLTPIAPDVPGGYRVETTPDYWAETTEQFYYGYASARRGTVVMEIEMYGTAPVDGEVLKGIAKQQWERLA